MSEFVPLCRETHFLKTEEQEALYDDKGKFSIPLYKALLFIHIANAIKSGKLSLKHSYRYLPIEQYLIDKKVWAEQKDDLLKKANLENFTDYNKVIAGLKKELNQAYCITNDNIINKNNKYVSFNKDGKAIVTTPKIDKEESKLVTELFPKSRFYPILQILSDINKVTNFTSYFEHYNLKYVKKRPSDEVFYSGIMGYGFDLGISRIAKISKGINNSTLENTVNWYFTLDNLYMINNLFSKYIDKLNVSNLFLKQQDKLHTASDGQKFNVAVDSLNSNYSFKYHGKEKGVSVYSFNDEKSRSFYSTAFSSSEREAVHVIDGLLHNEEIMSNIHSTDTHGYTETVFATTNMLNIFFAPRIKNLKKQKLYSFKN
ncbi:Tn3 family transposase, partial [Pseudomonadota bacterium]